MATKINTKERNKLLKRLKGWKKTRGRDAIEKSFVFDEIIFLKLFKSISPSSVTLIVFNLRFFSLASMYLRISINA